MKLSIAFVCLILPSSLATAGGTSSFHALAKHTSTIVAKILPSTIPTSATNILKRQLQEEACGQNCCTLCADGSDATNLDASINFGEFADDATMTSMTCEEGSSTVNYFPSDDESCPVMQLVGYSFCGCTSPPAVEGLQEICTLCYDGSTLPDPEMIIDTGNGETMSCGLAQLSLGFLDAMMSDISDEELTTMEDGGDMNDIFGGDIDVCSVMQNSVGIMCGCAANPAAPAGCNICPTGTTLANPNKVVEIDEEEPESMSMTCEVGAQQASFLPSDDALCALIQTEAAAAGCKCEDIAKKDTASTDDSSSGPANDSSSEPADDSSSELDSSTGTKTGDSQDTNLEDSTTNSSGYVFGVSSVCALVMLLAVAAMNE